MEVLQRIRLEALNANHAELIFEDLKDERIYTHIPDKLYLQLDELKARHEMLIEGPKPGRPERWLNWVVFDVVTNNPVGTLQATLMTEERLAYVAYVIWPKYWRQGYASEAFAWLMEEIKSFGSIDRAEAYIDIANESSLALIRKFGFLFKERNEDSEFVFEKRLSLKSKD